MPSNVGLLLDLAHFQVSANTLKFNKYENVKRLNKYIKGYHISDNDGRSDSNLAVTRDSWFWSIIKKDLDYYSIEVYDPNIENLVNQYKLINKILLMDK